MPCSEYIRTETPPPVDVYLPEQASEDLDTRVWSPDDEEFYRDAEGEYVPMQRETKNFKPDLSASMRKLRKMSSSEDSLKEESINTSSSRGVNDSINKYQIASHSQWSSPAQGLRSGISESSNSARDRGICSTPGYNSPVLVARSQSPTRSFLAKASVVKKMRNRLSSSAIINTVAQENRLLQHKPLQLWPTEVFSSSLCSPSEHTAQQSERVDAIHQRNPIFSTLSTNDHVNMQAGFMYVLFPEDTVPQVTSELSTCFEILLLHTKAYSALEISAKVCISPTASGDWQLLQIPGLPIDRYAEGRATFEVMDSQIEVYGTAHDLNTVHLSGHSITTPFKLEDSGLRLVFRAQRDTTNIINYDLEVITKASVDLTDQHGIVGTYAINLSLLDREYEVLGKRSSITFSIRYGPYKITQCNLEDDCGRRVRDYFLGEEYVQDEQICRDLTLTGDMVVLTTGKHLTLEIQYGQPDVVIEFPYIYPKLGHGRLISEVVILGDAMEPLKADFRSNAKVLGWQYERLDHGLATTHRFVRKPSPRGSDYGFFLHLSTLTPVKFAENLESTRISDTNFDGSVVLHLNIHNTKGAEIDELGELLWECEMHLDFRVPVSSKPQLVSFFSGDWTPTLALVNGKTADKGQFYVNTDGEIALYRNSNLLPGDSASLSIFWKSAPGSKKLVHQKKIDSYVSALMLPRLVGVTLAKASITCKLDRASLTCYNYPSASFEHDFERSSTARLPLLNADSDIILSTRAEYGELGSEDANDHGNNGGIDNTLCPEDISDSLATAQISELPLEPQSESNMLEVVWAKFNSLLRQQLSATLSICFLALLLQFLMLSMFHTSKITQVGNITTVVSSIQEQIQQVAQMLDGQQ
jgi:hypothetical protein